MFEILDFDANFKAYHKKWMELNKGRFKTFEEMEEAMPEVYMRWLNSPAAFLGGKTPGSFFDEYSSAPELVKWMRLYDAENVPVPDQLLDRISDLGKESVKPLIFTAKNPDHPDSLRMLALSLLKEVDAGDEPWEMCLDLVLRRSESDELADMAAELMQPLCARHADELLMELDGANEYAKETLLDLLSNLGGDERILGALLQQFESDKTRTALYASLLGKYQDARALPQLQKALSWQEINYLDYLEIRSAIEALGGECGVEREFAGDPYYETLKGQN